MDNLIRLLPDNLANQIAAGEVVQRPSSVVKELLENAIDAGSEEITLSIKDGGKTLISIRDNGCGMSPTDALMCFERHATSKLNKAEDLFALKTMGFRGEALASIAAVSRVELITKRAEDQVGTKIIIEGGKLIINEVIQSPVGTAIFIRDLFFNIPARRNFLKSNDVEKRRAFDEFVHIALAYPKIKFQLFNNDEAVYHLMPGNLKMRTVNLFKGDIVKKLLEVHEETPEMTIHGLIGTADFTKKTRGDQFLYVNNRFVRNNYLNHAILSAYVKLIDQESFPFYILFLEVAPDTIDVNVHPTKQEIKFEDEQLIYAYVKSAVRHTLSYNLVAPAIDFEKNEELTRIFDVPNQVSQKQVHQPKTSTTPKEDYRINRDYKSQINQWQNLYAGLKIPAPELEPPLQKTLLETDQGTEDSNTKILNGFDNPAVFQLHQMYIIRPIKSGLMVINQQAAHHRVLYEQFLNKSLMGETATMPDMFPKSIELDERSKSMFEIARPTMENLGFSFETTEEGVLITGYPVFVESGFDFSTWMDRFLENVYEGYALETDILYPLAESFADTKSIRKGQSLTDTEMNELTDKLFACSEPAFTSRGEKCFFILSQDELSKMMI